LYPTVVSTAELVRAPADVAVAFIVIDGVPVPEVSGAPLVTVRVHVIAAGPTTGAAGEQLHPFKV